VEKLFILVGNKLAEKKGSIQDVIVSVLPGMLYPHLKRVLIEIKETYGAHKAFLAANVDDLVKNKKLGPEYARYWKFIGGMLSDEVILFHTFRC
jgi:hypothetical protein